jgi:ankyrin repeat protein
MLLEQRAGVNALRKSQWPLQSNTALTRAAFRSMESILRLLLQAQAELRVYINTAGEKGENAACNGHESIVRLLLEQRADVNAALRYSASGCQESFGSLLLELKADVNAVTTNQYSALMYSARKGRESIVRLLLELKADVNAESVCGGTSLMHDAASGYLFVCNTSAHRKQS